MTSEEEKRLILLLSMRQLNGGGTKKEVLDNIQSTSLIKLSDFDRQTMESRDEIRWRNDLAYVRKHLVSLQYVDDTGWNQWHITQKGEAYLEGLILKAKQTNDFNFISEGLAQLIYPPPSEDTSYFSTWMRNSGLSDSSIQKYEGAICGVLSQWAQENGIISTSLSEITNSSEFAAVAEEIQKLEIFQTRNSTGHYMYSSALLKYSQYLSDSPSVLIESDIESIMSDQGISVTEKLNLIKSRIGQGAFRGKLINFWKGCAVTGFPIVNLLVASHIKPWSVSSNSERLDAFNGLLLLPNLDRAFDLGYITFDSQGNILISSVFKNSSNAGISASMKINLTDKHQAYLAYHREHVFKE